MEALANVTATGSVCVCCVRTAPAAPRKICSDRGRTDPTTSTGLAKLREKSLEIPVFGWKVCDIFVFKDTQVPFFSPPRFIPQSRGKIAKISKKTTPNSRPGLWADQSCLLWLRLKAALKWKSIHNFQAAFQAAPARAFAFQLFNKRQSHSGRFVSLFLFPSPGCVKKEKFVATRSLSSVRAHSRRFLFSGIFFGKLDQHFFLDLRKINLKING